MSDITSLHAKVAALKAKIENNSISPEYLGAILDEIIDTLDSGEYALPVIEDTLTSAKGAPNGLAPLGPDLIVPEQYLPKRQSPLLCFAGFVQDVTAIPSSSTHKPSDLNCRVVFDITANRFLLEVVSAGVITPDYYNNWPDGDAWGETDLTGKVPQSGRIYHCEQSGILYHWTGSTLESLGIGLGHTQGTAYPGEEGAKNATDIKAITDSKGMPGGLAPLNEEGIIPARFIPGAMDDVKEFDGVVNISADNVPPVSISGSVKVLFNATTGCFIARASGSDPAQYANNWEGAESYGEWTENGYVPASDKVYVDRSGNRTYRWSGTQLVVIGTDLALGHTSATAYPGNEGQQLRTDFDAHKQAYQKEHSQRINSLNIVNWLLDDDAYDSLADALTALNEYTPDIWGWDMLLYAMIRDDSPEGWSWKAYAPRKNVYSGWSDMDYTDPANWKQLGEENTHKVFDDMFRAATGTAGTIDHTHYDEPDASGNRRHTPYYLNTLWLTYEEAVAVMETKPPRTPDLTRYLMDDAGVRTNLPLKNMPDGGGGVNSAHVTVSMAFNAPDLEVVNLGSENARFRFKSHASFIHAFNGVKLHTIIGIIDFFASGVYPNGSDSNHIMFGPALKNVKIKNLNTDLKLVSPVISLESLRYMIQNSAAPAAGITLTVHSDVYAKITDTTNTDWYALLDLAAQKNINIATTA